MITTALLTTALLAAPQVTAHDIDVRLDPATHQVAVVSQMSVTGPGLLTMGIDGGTIIQAARLNNVPINAQFTVNERVERNSWLTVNIPQGEHALLVSMRAVHEEDVESGEHEGQIHNFAVQAHVGEDGVFLSERSNWHLRPLDERGQPQFIPTTLHVKPIDDWTFVASGDPADERAGLTDVTSKWRTPRPVDGMALAGSRFVRAGLVHETSEGPVEIVMYTSESNKDKAELFMNAAAQYLDIYVPLLGRFPYKRFTIAENFFSSGFAFPGFTLLGPRVVAGGHRSLLPGYLDHELVHNWWGNGVYVNDERGNWCEALTSYCTNYFRRIADEGEEAGRAYRRGILMKLSSDPQNLDNGPVSAFGSASKANVNRFVGYEKGSFIMMMIESRFQQSDGSVDRTLLWEALRAFADKYMGKQATWRDLMKEIELVAVRFNFDRFCNVWLDQHIVPGTLQGPFEKDTLQQKVEAIEEWKRRKGFSEIEVSRLDALVEPISAVRVVRGEDEQGHWFEVDPDFYVYRSLPPEQIIPTIAGVLGADAVNVITNEIRSEVQSFTSQFEQNSMSSDMLLIGKVPIMRYQFLISKTGNPITFRQDGFAVGQSLYDQPDHAVLHTMQHPDHPGSYITLFWSNGEEGWKKLRVARFYSRDSTIVWKGDRVVKRLVHEPDRRIYREPVEIEPWDPTKD